MKHLDKFNEKMGLNMDIKSQCDKIYAEINLPENKKKNKFKFVLYTDKGNTFFDLLVDKASGLKYPTQGQFRRNRITDKELEIGLLNRNDRSTLLHEMKHMYNLIMNKKQYSSDFYKTLNFSKDQEAEEEYKFTWVFYIFDQDEFEAKYHDYYIHLDEYIGKKLKLLDKKRPTEWDIIELWKKFFNEDFNEDVSWTNWWDKTPMNFRDKFGEKKTNQFFYQMLKKKNRDFAGDIFNFYLDIAKDFYHGAKSKIGHYTQEEKLEIDKLISKYEKEIERRKKIYKRKFVRLCSLMVDKWIPKKDETPMKYVKTNEEFVGEIKKLLGMKPQTVRDYQARFNGLTFDGETKKYSGTCKKCRGKCEDVTSHKCPVAIPRDRKTNWSD